jgi:membrane-bound lytic murein transglycosylase D
MSTRIPGFAVFCKRMKAVSRHRAIAMMIRVAACVLILIPASARASEILTQDRRFQKLGVILDPWSEAQVRFWRRIYTEFASSDWLVHDSMNPARIYSRHFSESEARAGRLEVKRGLLALSGAPSGRVSGGAIDPALRGLYEAMDAIEDPRAYRFAAEDRRLRIQSGRKDRVELAFGESRPYLKRMREMFREEGVPEELVLLPFVESAFNHEAKSKSGAAGIWQFMPRTASEDLRVGHSIDERFDPLKSTRAAARFLRRNHQMLGSWALAVMAYHHGPALVKKAVKTLGTTDPVRLIRIFKAPSFRFASRNYLFEFLAMCDVHREREQQADPGLPPYLSLTFPKSLKIGRIVEHYRLDRGTLKRLNPHFREPIWTNQAEIPAHYPVRVAGITLEEFRKLQYP